MRRLHEFQTFLSQPLMLSDTAWGTFDLAIQGVLRSFSQDISALDSAEKAPKIKAGPQFAIDPKTKTATVELNGVLGKRIPGWMESAFGMSDVDRFTDNITAAAEHRDVNRIRVRANSPGGSVLGMEETMDTVRQISESGKHIDFESDMLVGSAAYFIASQGNTLRGTPSSNWGSIGALMVRYDMSDRYEKDGVKPKVYRTGALKSPGHPGEPITAEQDQHFQSEVQSIFDRHNRSLTEKRPQIDEALKDGRVLRGDEAYWSGLIDEVISN